MTETENHSGVIPIIQETTKEKTDALATGVFDSRDHMTAVQGRRLFVSDPRLEEIDPRPLSEILAANFPKEHLFDQEALNFVSSIATVIDSLEDLPFYQKRRLFIYSVWERNPEMLEMAGHWLNLNKTQSVQIPDEIAANPADMENVTRVKALLANGEASIPALSEVFRGVEINSDQRRAMNILDSMSNLSFNEKKSFFFYFLWQQNRSFVQIKEFEDIREDITSVVDRVIYDDRLVDEYSRFYQAFQRERLGELLRRGYSITESSEELEIDPNEAIRMKRILIFEGKLEPNPARRKSVEEFREFCLRVEKLKAERPELTRQELAAELTTSIKRLDEAIYLLRLTGRVQKVTRSQRRKEKDVEDENKIVQLRIQLPDLSQSEISRLTNLPRHRVAYFISRAIRTNIIPRKRGLPTI